MFKLVVLTAFLAAAAAEPGLAYYGSPLAYNAGYYPSAYYNTPLATTYAAPLAPAVAPIAYSAPVAHLIKKRSVVPAAPLIASSPYSYSTYPFVGSNYIAPAAPLATTYSYSAPLVSSAYTAPFTHLIKKRSLAPLVAPVATSYIAPASYAATTYAASPYFTNAYASPYYSASPLAYSSPFFIKK